MKSFTKIATAALLTAVAAGTTMFGFSGSAAASAAACKWQYQSDGNFTTSQTPAFNSICGVDQGIGDEPNFVRIRQSSNGNDQDNQNNPNYSINGLTSACNDGDKFDVWNYLHNDAMSDFNNNGSGTAVAHNVESHLTADLGKTSTTFHFGDTITASNAASVSDSVVLNCNGQPVKLSLVPSTVHLYSTQYGWKDLADGSINGAVKMGSPTFGSGDMWGCWNYRMVVVYEVTVSKVQTPPQVTATCDALGVNAEEQKVSINNFKFTAKNASVKNVVINWGDQSQPVTLTATSNDQITQEVMQQSHTFTGNGPFVISAVVNFVDSNGNALPASGGPGTACAETVTFTPNQPPTVTPPTSTTVTTPPSKLVNTGAGSTLGIFAAATALGAVAYRKLLARKLARQ